MRRDKTGQHLDEHLLALGVLEKQADGVAHIDELLPGHPAVLVQVHLVKERATLGLVGIAQGASAGLQLFFRGKTVILCRVRKCKEGLGVRRNPQTQSHFEVSYVLFALGGICLQHSLREAD
jgi:hypothetical protein